MTGRNKSIKATRGSGSAFHTPNNKDSLQHLGNMSKNIAHMYQGQVTIRASLIRTRFFKKGRKVAKLKSVPELAIEAEEHENEDLKFREELDSVRGYAGSGHFSFEESKADKETQLRAAQLEGPAENLGDPVVKSSAKLTFETVKENLGKKLSSLSLFNRKDAKLRRQEKVTPRAKTFTLIYSFTVKGGYLYQRTTFENAVKLCTQGEEDLEFCCPEKNVIYM
mmetsp:Transcript_41518/g.66723  ORF Transcript_41518/g.66723 Transcript_41518/m.66723 type:complete len:223 (-) Transcript_41518:344-1012(-)